MEVSAGTWTLSVVRVRPSVLDHGQTGVLRFRPLSIATRRWCEPMSLMERLLPKTGEVLHERYVLGEELGRGGFGVVFRATHRRLKQDVAIKVVLPHVMSHPSLSERFEREVMVAKGLQHPNTTRVIDYAETATGLPYFVMEYLRGASLDRVLYEGGAFSHARARRVAVQTLKSLSEAHANGVVHRDLKPGNIMLCDIPGEQDFVKVLDFGIAKALTDDDKPGLMTSTGMVLGTPNYMSPEQARALRDIDGRSDLYAVALIIAECLAGRVVVNGGSPAEVLLVHLSAGPVPMPAAAIHSPFARVLARALAKDKTQRYGNAVEMIAALEALGPLSEEKTTDKMVGRPLTPVPTPAQQAPSLTPLPPQQPSSGVGDWGPPPKTTPIPQLQVGEADGHVHTVHAPRPQAAPESRTGLVLLVLVLLLGAVIGVVVVLSGGGDDGEPVANPGPEVGTGAAGDTPANEGVEEAVLAGAPEVTPAPTNPQPEGPTPAEVAAGEAQAAIVLDQVVVTARGAVGGALPRLRAVTFEGTRGASVSLDGVELGVIPFTAVLPALDHEIDVHAARSRYLDATPRVSLAADRVVIDLERAARTPRPPAAEVEAPAADQEPAAPAEPAAPTAPSFGGVSID